MGIANVDPTAMLLRLDEVEISTGKNKKSSFSLFSLLMFFSCQSAGVGEGRGGGVNSTRNG